MGSSLATHLTVLLVLIFKFSSASRSISTYDLLVGEQLRPYQRGGYSRPLVDRPENYQKDLEGRHITIDSSQYSNSSSDFEGIYKEGERNRTVQATFESSINQIKPQVTIGHVRAGVELEFGNSRSQVVSLGGHPSSNMSSSSQTVSLTPVFNGVKGDKFDIPIELINGLGLGGLVNGGHGGGDYGHPQRGQRPPPPRGGNYGGGRQPQRGQRPPPPPPRGGGGGWPGRGRRPKTPRPCRGLTCGFKNH